MRDVPSCLPAPSRALSRLPVSPSSSQAPLCSSFPQDFSNPSKIEVLHPPGECQSCSRAERPAGASDALCLSC